MKGLLSITLLPLSLSAMADHGNVPPKPCPIEPVNQSPIEIQPVPMIVIKPDDEVGPLEDFREWLAKWKTELLATIYNITEG